MNFFPTCDAHLAPNTCRYKRVAISNFDPMQTSTDVPVLTEETLSQPPMVISFAAAYLFQLHTASTLLGSYFHPQIAPGDEYSTKAEPGGATCHLPWQALCCGLLLLCLGVGNTLTTLSVIVSAKRECET
jgi:hypothetical protein